MKNSLVYFAPAFFPENSGYSNAIQALCTALAESGMRISVITPQLLPSHLAEIEIPGVNVIRVKGPQRLKSIFLSWTIFNSISKRFSSTDQKVFIESGEYPLLALMLQKKYGQNNVVMRIHGCYETEFLTWRNRLMDRFNHRLLSIFLNRARKIASTNSNHVDFLIHHHLSGNRLQAARKFFSIIPNAVLPPKELVRGSLPASEPSCKTFLTLGRMEGVDSVGQKGFEDIIAAWSLLPALLSKSEQIPCLNIIGSGDQQKSLKNLAEKLDIGNKVRFLGPVSRSTVYDYIENSAACILPSRYEGFSMFAAEAISAGAVLIGTRLTGLADMIDHEESGFLIQPHAPNEIAEMVVRIVRSTPAELSALREAAIRKFSRVSSPDVLVRAVKTILNA